VKVAVVGAGGVGSVFGGRLAGAGHEVWLVHRRPEVVEALLRTGLQLSTPGAADEWVWPRATTDTADIGPVDLVLILTKSTDTRAAAEAARMLVGPATSVLTLQNGLGNLETIAAIVGVERSLMGMTYVGAALLSPGHAALTAPGPTFIGEPNGTLSERIQYLASALTSAGLPTQATERLWDQVWGKLIINAALNATCALTDASGQSALQSEAASHWLGLVAEETARVAAALGISLPYADPAERVRQHCRDVGPSKPSMLQDMQRERPTEIQAINGAVVREGLRLGVHPIQPGIAAAGAGPRTGARAHFIGADLWAGTHLQPDQHGQLRGDTHHPPVAVLRLRNGPRRAPRRRRPARHARHRGLEYSS
jgi:2-dehydropantoate 2-reductase